KKILFNTTPEGLTTSTRFENNDLDGYSVGKYIGYSIIIDDQYYGYDTTILVIEKIPASITITDTVKVFSGNPHSVSYSTNPAELSVDVYYDGSTKLPVESGIYPVVAE